MTEWWHWVVVHFVVGIVFVVAAYADAPHNKDYPTPRAVIAFLFWLPILCYLLLWSFPKSAIKNKWEF